MAPAAQGSGSPPHRRRQARQIPAPGLERHRLRPQQSEPNGETGAVPSPTVAGDRLFSREDPSGPVKPRLGGPVRAVEARRLRNTLRKCIRGLAFRGRPLHAEQRGPPQPLLLARIFTSGTPPVVSKPGKLQPSCIESPGPLRNPGRIPAQGLLQDFNPRLDARHRPYRHRHRTLDRGQGRGQLQGLRFRGRGSAGRRGGHREVTHLHLRNRQGDIGELTRHRQEPDSLLGG